MMIGQLVKNYQSKLFKVTWVSFSSESRKINFSKSYANFDSQYLNFLQTLLKLDASFDREISVDAVVTSVTPLIFSNMGGGLLTITGSGLYSSRYRQTEVNVCSSILSHTGTEIICETRPSKGEGSINIDIKYYINKGTGKYGTF